jgi:predicted Zn-dependent protease with MMP-like domain
MDRRRFERLVTEALDALPARYRRLLENVAVVVEDVPDRDTAAEHDGLLMGLFHGTPRTEKSVWDSGHGPDRVILYQKNIEAVCADEAEVREEVRLTVLHELGHYFGLDEAALEDV